ncbi:hypothetical protein LCGC14_0224680 [marine sediment metagenome]|uniref:Transcription factor TFIIB cyclin-like domain-containing protein n=1 Tax=marine sediment metagenome TaxID=412755 RepID=A0A0F9UGV5_9ZZZZ|nr:hypothetical protein [bacterium]
MNQSILGAIEHTCDHMREIIISGKIVCQQCGLEIGEHYVNSMVTTGKYTQKSRFSRQYVGSPYQQSYYDGLGTIIHIDKESLKGVKNLSKFRRLKRMNVLFLSKEHLKVNNTLKILHKVGFLLDLPYYILNDCAIRYKKINSTEIHIINRVSCLCFCLWDSIRHFKYKTTLKEILKIFRKTGHRVNGKSIIRDGCIYRETLYKKGMRKTSPKNMRDYIARQIAALSNNIDYIKNRLKTKKLSMKPEKYISKLESLCYCICDKTEKYFGKRSLNPFDTSAACVYFAGLLLSKQYKVKTIMIQNKLAKITNVSAYCIRDIFKVHFKQFL